MDICSHTLSPQCFPPARHLHRPDCQDVPDDDVRSLAGKALQDLTETRKFLRRESAWVDHCNDILMS